MTASGIGESFAIPKSDSSLDEIARALSVLASRDAKRQTIQRIAEHAGVDLTPAQCWLLIRIDEDPAADPAALARRAQVAESIFEDAAAVLEERGLVERENGTRALTEAGAQTRDRLIAARRERLSEHLAGWSPEQHADLATLLNGLAREADLPAAASVVA